VTIIDAIIIYLACGAPFGVYTFLQNRETFSVTTLWIKTILAWAIWPIQAIEVVSRGHKVKTIPGTNFDASQVLDARDEKRIAKIKKVFESTFLERDAPAAIYEFREVFERYTGLSTALMTVEPEGSYHESELHRVTGHKNSAVASACLNRRNLLRLVKHQIEAREDFYKVLVRLAGFPENLAIASVLARELADILKDGTAESDLKRIFAEMPQTAAPDSVNEQGRELWKPAVQQPFSATRLPMNLTAASATATPSTED
jgi:hypothetical protein